MISIGIERRKEVACWEGGMPKLPLGRQTLSLVSKLSPSGGISFSVLDTKGTDNPLL